MELEEWVEAVTVSHISRFLLPEDLSFPEAHLPLAGVAGAVALWVLGQFNCFKVSLQSQMR